MDEDPWSNDIPNKYQPGQVISGKVTKITNFGVFVGLEDGLEGLLHISELADHKVENPEEVVKVGEEIEVKILRVDTEERKIGLSRKRVEWAEDEAVAASSDPEKGKDRQQRTDLKGGLGDAGPLIAMPSEGEPPPEAAAQPEAAKEAETPAEPETPSEPEAASEAEPESSEEPGDAPSGEEKESGA
jgi:small subunit ribosomal protein S1